MNIESEGSKRKRKRNHYSSELIFAKTDPKKKVFTNREKKKEKTI